MRSLRLAICQIECHPALYAGHIRYLEEPFAPSAKSASLSSLATRGVPVADLQSLCLQSYEKWAHVRLQRILHELEKLDPAPDIALFPEGAITISMLGSLKAFSDNSTCSVFGGTHTPQRNISAMQVYRKIGIKANRINRLVSNGVGNILPIFSSKKARVVEKKLASPAERSIMSTRPATHSPLLKCQVISAASGDVRVLPVICAEALQQPRLPSNHDIVVVFSFDMRPQQFSSFISSQVRNRKFVVYCNDGQAGGSMPYGPDDVRQPNWMRDALPDGLPPGDNLMVVEVDLDTTAVEVGTATPNRAMRLVALRSIVAEKSEHAAAAKRLEEIRNLDSSEARALELEALLKFPSLTVLQRIRFEHLREQERRGLPTTAEWKALGSDCLVSGITDLNDLEGTLAASCVQYFLTNALGAASQNPETSQAVLEFVSKCQNKAHDTPPLSTRIGGAEERLIVDRERETQEVCTFLESDEPRLLEITGLPQIGKTAIILKSLRQLRDRTVKLIELSETASSDFILFEILKLGSVTPSPPYSSPVCLAKNHKMVSALRRLDVLCICRCHFLLDHGVWRDETLEGTLLGLVESAAESNTKLIFESQRELPLNLDNPGVRRRKRIRGLASDFGKILFDAQLRRVGLTSTALGDRDKDSIIGKMGGHPVAIAIAADAVYEVGGKNAVKAVRRQDGFFWTFLRRLIGELNLTDEETLIVKLFCLARDGVRREVVAEASAASENDAIRNLLAFGVLELAQHGMLRVASVIRDYFDAGDLPPKQVSSFHNAAMRTFAEMSREMGNDLSLAIEAEYHAGLAGVAAPFDTKLMDGALGTAHRLYSEQKYEQAGSIIDGLLRARRQTDILRLAALVSARRNRLDEALGYAEEVFRRNRRDVRLLSELANVALTQSQERIAEQLVRVAREARVENESILMVEGRIYLRRRKFDEAEVAFSRAKQLTKNNPWPFFYLGQTYLRLGRLDNAVDVLYEGDIFCYENKLRSRRAVSAIRTQLGVAYLLQDEIELAEPIIESLVQEHTSSPEVARAYAMLTIKREGIDEAHKALKKLERAGVRSRRDRCQYHLFCGLFYLGIQDKDAANREFSQALTADRQNVFVMMKQARTLYDIALELWTDGQSSYRDFVNDCANLVRQILRFDSRNSEGMDLLGALRSKFGVDV